MKSAQALRMGAKEASRIDRCAYYETVIVGGEFVSCLFYDGKEVGLIAESRDVSAFDSAKQWIELLGTKLWILIVSENINEVTGDGHKTLIALVKSLSA